jgi:aspartate/methionine/tyrosine aminotransferase
MFTRIAYLEFAGRWFGRVRYDLATSGLAPIGAAELGSAAPDDRTARDRFIAAISSRYGVPKPEIVPCLGAAGALFAAYAALLDGGALLVEEPGYEPLWRSVEGLGSRVDRFARTGSELDPDAVLRALAPDTRMVAITNPHNPSGLVAGDETISALADSLRARDVWLLVDEVYLEVVAPSHTARRLAPNIIACNSVTKCLGVPWARAGWLLLPAELGERAMRIELFTMGLAPPSSWAWGERAVTRADALLERARRLQAGKRELVDDFALRHREKLSWTPSPEEAWFGWFTDARGRDLTGLIERGIESSGVLVSPGEFFGDPRSFRLSWTAPPEIVAAGLQQLEKVLDLT